MRLYVTIFFLAFSFSSLLALRDFTEGTWAPSTLGSGNVGSQQNSSTEGSIFNPALLGTRDTMGGAVGTGFSNSFTGVWGHYYYPGSLGVMGVSVNVMNQSNSIDISKYGSLQFGYGKEFIPKLYLGFYFSMAYGQAATGDFYSLGFQPSLYYRTGLKKKYYKGLGIYDLDIYATPRNLNLNLGSGSSDAPRFSFHVGSQAGFYKKGKFLSLLFLEVYGIGKFDSIPINSGFKFQYSLFNARLGYMFSRDRTTLKGVSLGAGVDYHFKSGSIGLNYAFLPKSSSRNNENYHFVSLNGTYGYIDTEPPEIDIETDRISFSPNFDGKNDYIIFSLSASDYSEIKNWKITIFNRRGRIVRLIENDTRKVQKRYSAFERVKNFFRTKETLVVPSTIRWDGTQKAVEIDNALNPLQPKFQPLIDGSYIYSFRATDIKGNQSKAVTGQLYIDTRAPTLKISDLGRLFSPNNDGALDTLTILHESTAGPNDSWKMTIKNEDNKVVLNKSWSGRELPSRYKWNGLTNDKTPAPEGIYSYHITGYDAAGNSVSRNIKNISLIRTITHAKLSLSSAGFSPNNDGVQEKLNFQPSLSTKKGLTDWRLTITDSSYSRGEEIPSGIRKWEGTNRLPSSIVWHGRDEVDQYLQDGIYYAIFSANYITGNHPTAAPKRFVIDTTAPIVGVEADINLFSPDGDGEKEEQKFWLNIEDSSQIKEFQFKIFETQRNEDGKKEQFLFKVFSGNEKYPSKIFWDGKGDAGNLVESATIYEYTLEAEDIYGNKSKSTLRRFETDIMVLKTEKGLKVRLSNIEFTRGKHEIQKSSYALLERMVKLLRRYNKYNIKVEGHTDERGSEQYNLELSEKRAKAVADFLIKSGLDKKIVTYQGLGEVEPLVPNHNDYNRSKNRRVEFLLDSR